MLITLSFKKSLIAEEFQGNYLKLKSTTNTVKYVYISDRFPKNMPAILVSAVFSTVFINPDIYWHRMFENEQGMPKF